MAKAVEGFPSDLTESAGSAQWDSGQMAPTHTDRVEDDPLAVTGAVTNPTSTKALPQPYGGSGTMGAVSMEGYGATGAIHWQAQEDARKRQEARDRQRALDERRRIVSMRLLSVVNQADK